MYNIYLKKKKDYLSHDVNLSNRYYGNLNLIMLVLKKYNKKLCLIKTFQFIYLGFKFSLTLLSGHN